MSRRILIIAGVPGVAALAVGALLYSWTFTPHGRMDLAAAIAIRSMPSGPVVISAERRERADSFTASFMPDPPPEVEIRETSFRAVATEERARIYIPPGDGPRGVVVWIHGGGFWMGGALELWDGQCAGLALQSGAIVVSIGYRLAPEHPFPAAVEDTWAGTLWVHENARSWGGDPNRLAVMGGSAGGNLAAVVAQRAKAEGGPRMSLQVLVVPTLNAGGEPTESMRLFAEGYGLNGMDKMRDAYFPSTADRSDPQASPLLAQDLRGLPPAVVHTAQFDPLRDEGELYAERLRAAGVPAEVRRFDGAIHGFLGSPWAQRESLAEVAAAVRRAFAPTS